MPGSGNCDAFNAKTEADDQWTLLGVLRLIGYRSLSTDNRLGTFDRWSLKGRSQKNDL